MSFLREGFTVRSIHSILSLENHRTTLANFSELL